MPTMIIHVDSSSFSQQQQQQQQQQHNMLHAYNIQIPSFSQAKESEYPEEGWAVSKARPRPPALQEKAAFNFALPRSRIACKKQVTFPVEQKDMVQIQVIDRLIDLIDCQWVGDDDENDLPTLSDIWYTGHELSYLWDFELYSNRQIQLLYKYDMSGPLERHNLSWRGLEDFQTRRDRRVPIQNYTEAVLDFYHRAKQEHGKNQDESLGDYSTTLSQGRREEAMAKGRQDADFALRLHHEEEDQGRDHEIGPVEDVSVWYPNATTCDKLVAWFCLYS
jgi:hypothetical protein